MDQAPVRREKLSTSAASSVSISQRVRGPSLALKTPYSRRSARTWVTLRLIPSKATAVGAPVRQWAVTATATGLIGCIAILNLLPSWGPVLEHLFVVS